MKLVLPHASVLQILAAVTDTRVLGLKKEYHANVEDGTQWVFWSTQGAMEKSAYFNNHFPSAIVRFADALDNVLVKNGVSSVKWHPASEAEAVQFQKQFWDSIKR